MKLTIADNLAQSLACLAGAMRIDRLLLLAPKNIHLPLKLFYKGSTV